MRAHLFLHKMCTFSTTEKVTIMAAKKDEMHTIHGKALRALVKRVQARDGGNKPMLRVDARFPEQLVLVLDVMADHMKISRSRAMVILCATALMEAVAEGDGDLARALDKAKVPADSLMRFVE